MYKGYMKFYSLPTTQKFISQFIESNFKPCNEKFQNKTECDYEYALPYILSAVNFYGVEGFARWITHDPKKHESNEEAAERLARELIEEEDGNKSNINSLVFEDLRNFFYAFMHEEEETCNPDDYDYGIR